MENKELKENNVSIPKYKEKEKEKNINYKINEKVKDPLVETNETASKIGNEGSTSVDTPLCESMNKIENTVHSNSEVIEEEKRINSKANLTNKPATIGSSTPSRSTAASSGIKLGREDSESLAGADWSTLYSRLNALTSSSAPACTTGELPCNLDLNRYSNILPNDATRVELAGHTRTDYINANYVEVRRAERRYVMSQGPLPHTCEQFWHMAWQERSPGVVMLNRVLERNLEKCHPYYPSSQDACLKFGHFKITCESREIRSDFIISKLRLENIVVEGGSNPRFLTHFQHTTWPDFGVPVSRRSFLTFLYSVRASGILDSPHSPPIVHCSAGVGRSGTFVLVDSCLRAAELDPDGGDVDIEDVIVEMRGQRCGCIQSVEQLRFSFMCVIYGVKNQGVDKGDKKETGDSEVKNSKRPREEVVHESEKGVKRLRRTEVD